MIGRRKSPDGMPFRLYRLDGKFKVSFYYQLPNGKRAFTLATNINNTNAVAEAKRQAIKQADELNGNVTLTATVGKLFERYFAWQEAMKQGDGRRKAKSTLIENTNESKNILKVFGKMPPGSIKPKHVYTYLSLRADAGAPAKANKEIALLSAVLEYGRTRGELEVNPCRGIKYNPTTPSTKLVTTDHLEFAIDEARQRGGSYLVLALCFYAAFLTTSRPTEMRTLTRKAITAEGLEIEIGKSRASQATKKKLIRWSPKLKDTIDEAISLQRMPGLLIFANTSGQEYTRSGWTTIWTRLMGYCEKRAELEGVTFERFALKDMRPKSVTERKERGEINITDATGHSDERMINKTYDRRTLKKSNATE